MLLGDCYGLFLPTKYGRWAVNILQNSPLTLDFFFNFYNYALLAERHQQLNTKFQLGEMHGILRI